MSHINTGVELELWVVDSDGSLADGADIVAAHDRIEPEFIDPLIEIRTRPHTDEFGLRRDLMTTLGAAIRAADKHDKRLVPLGTPLAASDVDANCERGELFEEIYGSGVRSAKNCAGTHVHFEKGTVIDQLNVLTALDPALALLNSSPYYCGENCESSSRAAAYRRKCGGEFRLFCDLWPYAASLTEWKGRVARAYERFKEIAVDRNVSAETVDAHFDPEDTVLNPVRLRHCQPTVEWRAPDAALPSEVLDVAGDIGTLIAETEHKQLVYGDPGLRTDTIGLPEFGRLQELSRQAICSGLESTAVTTYLRKLGFDPSKYQPVTPQMDGPQTISEPKACELRLEQAGRLEEDIEAIRV